MSSGSPNDFFDMAPNSVSQTAMYPSLLIPDNNSYNVSWADAESAYSAQSSAAPTDFSSTWSYAASMASSQDDPSMFSATTTGCEWPTYDAMANTSSSWMPSVNPLSSSYPVSYGGLSPGSAWGSSDQTLQSPYSEVAPNNSHRPPLVRSISADSAINSGMTYSAYYPSPAPALATVASSAGEDEDEYTADDIPTTKSKSKSKSSKPTSKSASKSESKSKNKPSEKTNPNKRKYTTSSKKLAAASLEKQQQEQMLKLFGPKMTPLPPSKDPQMASEQFRREVWRVCKAEAAEMSQRRMLLQDHNGAIERETRQLEVSVGQMREAIMRQHMELEDVVSRAEKLVSRRYN